MLKNSSQLLLLIMATELFLNSNVEHQYCHFLTKTAIFNNFSEKMAVKISLS